MDAVNGVRINKFLEAVQRQCNILWVRRAEPRERLTRGGSLEAALLGHGAHKSLGRPLQVPTDLPDMHFQAILVCGVKALSDLVAIPPVGC